jgi:hypothetical protein
MADSRISDLTAATNASSGDEFVLVQGGVTKKIDFDKLVGSFPAELVIACSDETTDLTTGTAKVTFRMPYKMNCTEVRANVNTAPVGSTIEVDINKNGASILGTVISIDASEKTSTTSATPPFVDTPTLEDDTEITIDIDQVGSSTAGKGLKVVMIGKRILT